MFIDERARWLGFWVLDRKMGGPVRKAYDEIRYAYRNGTSIAGTEEKIARLIDHARRTTEFYRNIPEGTPLSEMPIVNKDTFRADYDAFLSSEYKGEKGSRVMSTSGSTGTPLRIVQNLDKVRHDTADGIFFGAMADYYIGMKMGFIRVWVHNVTKSPLRLLAENMIMVDSSDLGDAALTEMLEMFRKKRVKCLLGYASALAEISRFIDRNHVDTSRFSVCSIIPISESMPSVVRQRLREQFNCPVQQWYSNEENGIMGIQGKDSDAYYIDSENFYFEILKMDSDEAAEPGELGRVVITDLRNYAMPIIRYDNGDLAVYKKIEKDGRFKLYLTELYGRRSDTIYDTAGNALTPFIITNNLWDVEGVRQYRFCQDTKDTYTLELNGDPDVMDEADIIGRILPYFGEGAKIRIEYVDEIPVLNSGKRKYIENRCPEYMR
ncbi:MAG TPA: CoF synthetase [Lachnospiraceae bacterium]|nr:CoF synthetase [Lachnospiraceae bacterium]